jgi:hypothetical protein
MRFLLVLLAALTICAPAQAQKTYSQAELDSLLAPVALQPDGVVSQVLIAATYPDDVAAAAAWSRANSHLRGDAAVTAVQSESWDPSVKSLVAFPDLLARMAESPAWLRDLGEAFLAQEPQVMDTVQGLRRRAQANGQLSTSGQTVVAQEGETIVVQPRSEVVYVRYYDPYVVYGPWWWPHYHPIAWRPWTPYAVVVHRGFFYTKPDWHHHHVKVIHRPVYAHPRHHHVAPGKWQHSAPMHRLHAPAQRVHSGPGPKPYVRVPESQRKPIVQQQHQQPMPAASGFSNQHREHRADDSHRRRGGDQQRSEPRREHRSDSHHNQRGRDSRGGGGGGGGGRGGDRGGRG